jgi:heme exporter protein B
LPPMTPRNYLMQTKSYNWAKSSVEIFKKELKSEFRTRYALNAIVMFALTTLVVVSFSIGQMGLAPQIQAAMFWVILFFSAMAGLSQVFVKEEETKTVYTLKLVAIPEAVFLGKLLFNFLLLIMLEILLVPLYVIFLDVKIQSWSLFFSVLILGSFGLTVATTIVAAIISKASVKGVLFAVLSFPILLPLLVTGINGTKTSLMDNRFTAGLPELQVLLSYLVVMLVISFFLFEFVWSE